MIPNKITADPEQGVSGVRFALPADEDQIFALLMLLHSENGMFGVNDAKVRQGIQWATLRKGGFIWLIDEGFLASGRPRVVATLGMLIVSDWYSDDEYLLERWNYVHPQYRNSGNYARKLIEQSKWTSDQLKLPVQVGINSFERTESKVRLYARHMPCVGAFFMYGQIPCQNKRMREETRKIKELNKKAHTERTREVVPLVETILRVGGRDEGKNVREQR
jgi:hypothetical protein